MNAGTCGTSVGICDSDNTGICLPDGLGAVKSIACSGGCSGSTCTDSFGSSTYDLLGRVSYSINSLGEKEENSYYGASFNILGVNSYNAGGSLTNLYLYDADGNLIKQKDFTHSEKNRDYTYDSEGKLVTIKSPTALLTYVYDTANPGHLIKEINQIFSLSSLSPLVTSYVYDSSDRLISITTPTSTKTYTYASSGDNLEKEELVTNNPDGTTTDTWIKYTYDSNGNILSKIDNTGAEVKYTYDSVSYTCQETTCTAPDCSTFTITPSTCSYDRLKDRTIGNFKVKVNYDSAGDSISYTRVDDAAVFTPTQVFDSEGLLKEDTERKYTYDSENNLQKVTIKDNSDGINSGEETYTWDSQGLVNTLTYADGEKEKWYYNPLGEKIAIVDTLPGLASGTTYTVGAVIKNFFFNMFATITGHAITGKAIDDGIIQNEDGSTSYTFVGNSGDFVSQKDYNELLPSYEAKYGAVPIEPQVDNTCVDFDGGQNEFNASYVSYQDEIYIDNCTSENNLQEYYCGGFFGKSAKSSLKTCQYGCISGACLAEPLAEYNQTVPTNQTDLPPEPGQLEGTGSLYESHNTGIVTGKVTGAYLFNGTENYVSSSDSGLPAGDSPRTFAGWFKLTNSNYQDNVVGILDYGTNGELYGSSPIIVDGRAGYNSISWTPYGTTVTANQKIMDTNWHYFVFVYAGNSKSTFYLDGVNQGLQTDQLGEYGEPGVNTLLNGSLQLGIWPGMPNISGIYLDEIGIWNRTLSDFEVSKLYNSGIGLSLLSGSSSLKSGLVAYYPFDSDVNDYSSLHRAGTIHGGNS